MKKLVLLFVLCLLLAGCNPRSRQPSENFVPSGSARVDSGGQPAKDGSESVGSSADADRPALQGGTVKEVFFREGDYTCDGSRIHYSYSLPMVDLPADYAMGCNQEIELEFGNPIREALSEMERFEPVDVQTVRYTAEVCGNVLTVRVYAVDVKGEERQAVYSLNAVTGEEPAYQEFLTAAGLQENQIPGLLTEAVTARYREQVGNRFRETDPRYTAALSQTLSAAANPALLHKHLTEDGKLAVYLTVYDPAGGSDLQEFILS